MKTMAKPRYQGLYIDPDKHHQYKKLAVEYKMPLSRFIAMAMDQWIAQEKSTKDESAEREAALKELDIILSRWQ